MVVGSTPPRVTNINLGNVGKMKPLKIYAENLEDKVLEQMNSAMEQDYVVQGAFMSDAHYGYSLPIGGVVATEGSIVPAWVGYDIGCGVCAVKTPFLRAENEPKREEIFNSVYRAIPTGFTHQKDPQDWDGLSKFDCTNFVRTQFDEVNHKGKTGFHQLGTLGGGNHFIEIAYGEDDRVWIVVHSGSRGVGWKCAQHYMKLASGSDKAKEGHYGLPVDSLLGQDYIADLNFYLEFALENRIRIVEVVIEQISKVIPKSKFSEDSWQLINRNHNHAVLDTKEGRDLWIHRKGATHAEVVMDGIIPGNMRDGSFVVKGMGNADSLYSSSHGAGRVLGRKQAQKTLKLEEFEKQLEGITAKVDLTTLDESPSAYKNIFEVMKLQSDLVVVQEHLKPIINVKA